ncbi:tryptophan--tRNA ligase [Granulosicoccus antarcticus]|uniref:Tryptophan--tRNA ligase n=1 Tax=Granulosicoccus antarcticus IMCC3135 TaxID=1192854 RepID=A0A2Z2NJJ7_9GAMM|nr:tryptophan--tRNA ligase [Granulosicoccus antarcticus]ASJ70241.1 Tryptophan--tRNA ligase [Granulosicoccus antarcticus IMCC3135]
MLKQTWLTGITTSGTPHLGNYVGAIRPSVDASHDPERSGFYFLADYHALIKNQDPAMLRQSRQEISAAWLALGLNTERATFYRQSDIPEIMEMAWMLTCMTAKGLLNRAHAYKASVQDNVDNGAADPDKGITMGLFNYPVLMSADILIFKATHVPVGRDQTQHLEMARDIAQRFNHHYGDHLVLPQAVVDEHASVLAGLDGRKMSKSYGNTIPLFETAKKLRKSIMKIKTNSQEPGEPKDPEDNTVFEIYRAFATDEQVQVMRQAYADGIGWGDAKQQLFELVDGVLDEPRKRYDELMANPAQIDAVLALGAEKARDLSQPMLAELRRAVGVA